MRREIITKTKLIALTRELLHGFYGRNVGHLVQYLDDNFVWIGAFDYQFATSKAQFLEIVSSELNATPFRMQDEYYHFICRDKDTFILCVTFALRNEESEAQPIQLHTRLTLVWKYIDGVLKLVHVHGSNAQDIPLHAPAVQPPPQQADDDFMGYIKTAVVQNPTHKIMFRATSGEHYILPEYDILYIQSEGQNSRIFTRTSEIPVCGILRTQQEKLSKTFYRVHKSYLINLEYLQSIRRYELTLRNQTVLPISKDRYPSLKQTWRNKI